jgi:phage head maturation protease
MRGIEERSSAGGVAVLSEPSTGMTMVGHFARFNQWTEIDSAFEGRFMQRIAPGAFVRTFKNDRPRRALAVQPRT